MVDIDDALTHALDEIGKEFRPNELAYLATTMKVEAPFRDRLAYQLHLKCEPKGFIIAREWNRIDLAVLDGHGSPVVLVELKAMYTFDALKNVHFFTSATSDDEVKARLYAKDGTSVYSLLLVTNVAESVLEQFRNVVKYSYGINKAIDAHGTSVLAKATDAINKDLKDSGRTVAACGHAEGGVAFGLKVSVHYWLVRNDRSGT
jgi:hypothetical protein